jgi:hypothetical protein
MAAIQKGMYWGVSQIKALISLALTNLKAVLQLTQGRVVDKKRGQRVEFRAIQARVTMINNSSR